MASAIDATKPTDGVPPFKSDMRANFAAAKSEIEALQAAGGSVAIAPLTEDTTPDGTADFFPSYDTSATGNKKVRLDNIRVSMANAATGFAQRTLKDKVGEFVSVKDFGAVGNGSVDDTANVQAAATAVAGTNRTLLLPHGTYKCAALDFSNVRRIVCEGFITSTIIAGQTAVKIGTIGNANLDMLNGDVELAIGHSASVNTGLTGSIGILVQGAAWCRFKLTSMHFDTGIKIAPANTANMYLSNCVFDTLRIYGCRLGLQITSTASAGGWVNQCRFNEPGINKGSQNISPGAEIGIQLDGGYASNNHVFNQPHLEALPTPIYLISASGNSFKECRLETAGAILLGDNTTTYMCANNYVTALVCQNGTTPTYTHQCFTPNFVGGVDRISWAPVAHIDYDGWTNNGTTYYHKGLHNTSLGKSFTSPVLTAATKSWTLAGADRGIVYVPVQKGDVLKVSTAWTGTPAGGTNVITIQARDAAFATLPTLTAGDMPYFGLSNSTSFANATPGTANFKNVTVTTYPLCRLISCNRTDVAYLSIETLPGGVDYEFFHIDRMISANANLDSALPNRLPHKFVANFTTAPDMPGQIGIQTTSLETRVAASATAWAAPMATSTTTALLAIGNAINTTDKYAGKTIFNTTSSRLCTATGSTAGSTWQPSDGTAVHTPV